ncbi:hypothetical protein LOTGIDRAFT_59863, partial [Lottia gigantea]
FITTFKDITVIEGETLHMEVTFLGIPAPVVTWILDDQPIKTSTDFLVTIDKDFSRLVIPEVIRDDEGEYQVILENEHGTAKTTAYITVKR